MFLKWPQNFAWNFTESLFASLIHGGLHLDPRFRTYRVDDFYGLQPDLRFYRLLHLDLRLKNWKRKANRENKTKGKQPFFFPRNKQEI